MKAEKEMLSDYSSFIFKTKDLLEEIEYLGDGDDEDGDSSTADPDKK